MEFGENTTKLEDYLFNHYQLTMPRPIQAVTIVVGRPENNLLTAFREANQIIFSPGSRN